LVLRGRQLPNRVVFAAHLTNFASGGLPTEVHAAYYAARARGGAGLIITEEHSVHPGDHPYEKLIRGHDPAVLPGYRVLTEAVHAHGVPVLAQLNHNGAQSTGGYTRRPVWAPSAVPDPTFREVPVAITAGQINELIAGFADVAARCVSGGFDGVELQASQSSIVRQFLDPATNVRTDGYGGPLPNRARFLLELVASVRAAIGPDRILGVRLGVDTLTEQRIAQACRVAALLGTDVDYLNTAVGIAGGGQHRITPPMGVPAGYALEFAAAVREAGGVPVVSSGRFTTPEQAGAALLGGGCDLVAVVRGQLADPRWGVAATTGGRVGTCLGCNQECVGRVGLNLPLRCVRNPRAGRESVPVPVPVTSGRRVLVVGGGPAGLRAAVTAARRGHRVTLCERDTVLGGQVVLAAGAPGRGELLAVVTDLIGQCEANVEVRMSTELDARGIRDFAADAVVLATGSRPSRPFWAIEGVCDVRDVLSGRVAPRGDVLVYDELGFHQGAWTAVLLAQRGCAVELMTPAMVAAQHLGLTLDRPRFRRRARELGIRTWTDRVVLGAEAVDGRVHLDVLHHVTGRHERRDYDAVVCALPGTARDGLVPAVTGVPMHRVGDCLAPRRLDAAIREGDRVAEAL
jgi:2,4-dienoyl-CoA reductase (NADPH2)